MRPEAFAAHLVERAAASSADVRFGQDAGTWGELLAAAQRCADWLTECGLRPGDVVAVVADAGFGTVATMFGAWRAGATISVLAAPASTKRLGTDYPSWLTERLDQLDARLLIATERHEIGWQETGAGPFGMCAVRNPNVTAPHTDPPLILQLTSGSTGPPKLVPVTAAMAVANVTATARRLELRSTDSVVSWLPLNHDMGLIGTLLLPALHGIALRLSNPDTFVRSPMNWLRELSDARATLTFAPHFAYALVARHGRRKPPAHDTDLSTLRHCLNGSEPIDGAEFAAFGEFAAEYGLTPGALRPGYGMAELGLVFSLSGPDEPMRTLTVELDGLATGARVQPATEGTTVVGCGRPLPGYALDIRDERGVTLPDGTTGEICVSGPSVFDGYPGTPHREQFHPDGAFRTGDLGFCHEGELFVCGRAKDVIIVRGENIPPQDIERTVAGLDKVRAGNVVAFGVRQRGAEAVVVAAETSRPSDELRTEITDRVRHRTNIRPADVVLLGTGELPKTTSGKLQRQLSKQTYLDGAWNR